MLTLDLFSGVVDRDDRLNVEADVGGCNDGQGGRGEEEAGVRVADPAHGQAVVHLHRGIQLFKEKKGFNCHLYIWTG